MLKAYKFSIKMIKQYFKWSRFSLSGARGWNVVFSFLQESYIFSRYLAKYQF